MKLSHSLPSIAAVMFWTVGFEAEAVILLAVDIEGNNGGTSTTEAGFVSLVVEASALPGDTFSTSQAGVNATIEATGDEGFLAGRDGLGNDRGGDLSDLTQQDLQGDLAAARGGDGGFTIQLTGLTIDEQITLTVWHNDANGGNSGFASPGAIVSPSLTAGGTLISATDGEHSNFSRPETDTFSGPYEDDDLVPSIIVFTPTSSTVDILLFTTSGNGFLPVSGFTVENEADPPPPPPAPTTGVLLAVDLQGNNGGTSTTEVGFVSLIADAAAFPGDTFSTSGNGVNATIGATGIDGFLAGRDGLGNDRGGDLSNLTQQDLHGDLVAARGGDGGFTIQLTELPLDTELTLTVWHNDANGGNSGFATPGATVSPSLTAGGTLISATDGEHSNFSRPDTDTFSGPYEDSALFPTTLVFTSTATTADILLSSSAENNFLPVSGFTIAAPEAPTLTLSDFSYDPTSGTAQVSLLGLPSTEYQLRSSAALDFSPGAPVTLTQDPSTLPGTIMNNGATVLTNETGNAIVQFDLGTSITANFVRAEEAPGE